MDEDRLARIRHATRELRAAVEEPVNTIPMPAPSIVSAMARKHGNGKVLPPPTSVEVGWYLPPRGCLDTHGKGKGKKSYNGHGQIRNSARLAEVARLLKLFYSHSEIEHALAPIWKCSMNTIGNYIAEVYERWRKTAPSDENERKRSAEAAALIYGEAAKRGELRTAIRAVELRSRILGLFVEKHELTGSNGNPLEVTVEDAHAEFAKRLAEHVVKKGAK